MANFQSLNEQDEYTEDEKYGVQNVIDEINEESPPDEELEEEEEDFGDLSDVEIRLEEANCLKALLNNSLFEEPLSPIAKRVERRIRAFIHTELKVLLGIKVVKAEVKLFSDDELNVLRALANKVLSKNGTTRPPETSLPVIVPAKIESAPAVRKNPSPEIPVKVRKQRRQTPAPTAAARPRGEPIAPQSPKPPEYTEVTLENGLVISGVSTATQARAPGPRAYPTLTAEQQANFYESQALSTSPNDGIMGLATAAVHRLNALTPEE